MITTVYFATNRAPDPTRPGGYGTHIVDHDQVLYGVVPVTGVDLPAESYGKPGAVTAMAASDFTDAVRTELNTTGRNLLVFIHGFDNSFVDAIKCAAFNREWFAASGQPATDTTVVAFTWPSRGELFERLPNWPDAAYRADQSMARQSGPHLAAFLRQILPLAAELRGAGKRAFLLAHSMGNHALANAIPDVFAAGETVSPIFNETILAAADEDATTFHAACPMDRLRDLSDRVSVYFSARDIAMDLSMAVNRNHRLGYGGPAGKEDVLVYPPAPFRSIDCTGVLDFFGLIPPNATHQYYRRSKTVRADIVKVMAGEPVAPGLSSLSALPFRI